MRQMFLNIVYFDSGEYCLKFKDLSMITPIVLNDQNKIKKNQESLIETSTKDRIV